MTVRDYAKMLSIKRAKAEETNTMRGVQNRIDTSNTEVISCRACGKDIVVGDDILSKKGGYNRTAKLYHIRCAKRLHLA